MADVLLADINKVYGDGFRAVKSFNLTIRDGEFVVFVGPSGCGKTTTLRMIAGLESITSGKLCIDGKVSNYLEPGERNLSMVFQNYALYPNMSVYENMAFGLRCGGVSVQETDRRVREAAVLLQIDDLLSHRPKELSGGQKQRVAIGSVLVRQPGVFLMDEPLSNLDAKLRSQMRVELAKLHRQMGTTVIYVTHDQVEAMTLGDRIVVMKDGLIQQVASPKEIYEQPANRFVAGFIGSPAMNFIDVMVCAVSGHLVLDYGAGYLKIPLSMEQILGKGGYTGKKLILGIRPEDLKAEGEDSCRLPMNVEIVEKPGAEVLLHGTICGTGGCARLSPQQGKHKTGDRWIYPDMSKTKLFDGITGESVLYGGGDR